MMKTRLRTEFVAGEHYNERVPHFRSYTPSGFWQERAFRMLYQQDWIDVATGWSTRGATRAELCMLRWV